MTNPAGLALLNEARALMADGKFREMGDLIRGRLQQDASAATGVRVDLANLLLVASDWRTITALLPPGTNALYETGWLNSLARGMPVNERDEPIPWLTYPAITFLEQRARKSWTVFEFGSGASTLWWAARVANVYSVEGDVAWHTQISARAPANASIALAEQEAAYLDAINRVPRETFDVVVVDGGWREACVPVAAAKVQPAGALVIDNSDTPELQSPLAALREAGWRRIDFFGLIPAHVYRGCTSVLIRDPAFLDVERTPGEIESCLGPTVGQAMAPR